MTMDGAVGERVGEGASGLAPSVAGRAAFELHCAPCHGPSGEGGYLGPKARPPRIAGADPGKLARQVRRGGDTMPAFSPAALSDATLGDLAAYVHASLPRPAESEIGPRALDPLSVGVVVWIAAFALTLALRALFRGDRL
jgi:ubiquinol-cytochrome c reductase cytochrome c subunit